MKKVGNKFRSNHAKKDFKALRLIKLNQTCKTEQLSQGSWRMQQHSSRGAWEAYLQRSCHTVVHLCSAGASRSQTTRRNHHQSLNRWQMCASRFSKRSTVYQQKVSTICLLTDCSDLVLRSPCSRNTSVRLKFRSQREPPSRHSYASSEN